MRKAQFHQDSEENMLLGDMQLENKDALLVNYVLLHVQLKPSRLKVSQDQMVQEELQDTILIWLSAYIVDFVKLHAQLMQLSKAQTTKTLQQLTNNYFTTRKNYWQTEIGGNHNWPEIFKP